MPATSGFLTENVSARAMGRTGQASIHAVLDDFTTKLKRRQFPASSVALARHTTELLIHAVAAQQALTVGGIIEGVRLVSKKLVDARPLGTCVFTDKIEAASFLTKGTTRWGLRYSS